MSGKRASSDQPKVKKKVKPHLTASDKIKIKHSVLSSAELATMFGVDPRTIRRIKKLPQEKIEELQQTPNNKQASTSKYHELCMNI